MISHWIVLHLCLVGALYAAPAPQHIGKLPRINNSQPSLHITNGNKTSVKKYPFVASVTHSGQLFGSAVILNKDWLLTIAWNVVGISPKELEFRTGSDFYDKGGQVLKPEKIIIHPKYNHSWDWDIAVVKTDKPIKMGKKVKPATLATTELEGGTKCSLAGWGAYDSTGNASEVILEAEVTTFDWKKCQETYKKDLTKRLLCIYDKNVGPRGGDFGDPLVKKGDTYMVHGLYVGGYACPPNKYPLLFEDVSVLRTWIEEVIQNDKDDDLN